MNEERHNQIAKAYREALFPLLAFKPEELEEAQKELEEQHDHFISFAPVLNPVAYFTARNNGELELNEIQAEVVRHLIAARKAAQKLGTGGVLGLVQKVLIERAEDELSDSK